MKKKFAIITVDGAYFETDQAQMAKERRDWEARRACERARELEGAGDYEGARSALEKLWRRIGERPAVDELPPQVGWFSFVARSSDSAADTIGAIGTEGSWFVFVSLK